MLGRHRFRVAWMHVAMWEGPDGAGTVGNVSSGGYFEASACPHGHARCGPAQNRIFVRLAHRSVGTRVSWLS